MAKQPPSNTTSSRVVAFSNAKSKLAVPRGLSKEALPFWQSIAATRAPDEWSPADIDIAAQLAEDHALLVALRAELDGDGWLTEDGKVSGAAILLNVVHSRVLATSRLLQIHPRGRTGQQSRSLHARRATAREAAETLDALGDNPLIPTH